MSQMLLGFRILVVDDESEILEILKEDFEMHGAKVMTAPGGHDAFKVAERFLPNVVLCDVQMARGDGLGLLSAIRSGNLLVKPVFILMSGLAEYDGNVTAALGAQGFIPKPFQLYAVRTLIVQLVGFND